MQHYANRQRLLGREGYRGTADDCALQVERSQLLPDEFVNRRFGPIFTRKQFIGTRHRIQAVDQRSEEHTSELQSLMRLSYAVFCLKKKRKTPTTRHFTP